MTYDVAAVRSLFPALLEGAAHFDGPGGSQTPTPVAEAVRDTLVSAISNRGDVTASERRAEAVVVEARAAMADLLGADPRGVVFGRSATALTYDLVAGPGAHLAARRRGHRHPARPRLQHPPVGAGRRVGGRGRQVGRLRARHRRAALRGRDVAAHRPHPARRHERRLQPHRHQAAGVQDRPCRPRGRRAALGRRRARDRARLGRPRRAGRRLLDLLALQVPRPPPRRRGGLARRCSRR